MLEIKSKIFNFNTQPSVRFANLFIVKNINELLDQNLINKKQNQFILNNLNYKKHNHPFYLSTENGDQLTIFSILRTSKKYRESTIDNAAKISSKLPKNFWNIYISSSFSNEEKYDFFLGWGLSFYHYKIQKNVLIPNLRINNLRNFPRKMINNCEKELLGIFLARDLINCPSNYLNPDEYEKIIKKIFKKSKPDIKAHKGKKFPEMFPLIHFVGRSSEFKPRIIEITWKQNKVKPLSPKIVIIGKGITFDSGGLDLKPSSSMLLMKKDMAGSAIALALARAIIDLNFKVNLKLIIPIAENSISDRSMRPLDVVYSRNKIPVEIGNTDAEGRLLLADAITYCQESKVNPDLIIDLATLTGAARVALGTEMPAVFSNNKKIANILIKNSFDTNDPLWELPLFSGYERFLKNENGSLSSTGFSKTGGAITAALFLEKFVLPNNNWMHLDLMGWNQQARPGYPHGGEAMGFRTLLRSIDEIYNDKSLKNFD